MSWSCTGALYVSYVEHAVRPKACSLWAATHPAGGLYQLCENEQLYRKNEGINWLIQSINKSSKQLLKQPTNK